MTNAYGSTEVLGTILFTNDTDYWQANSLKQGFQNATTFFQLGGEDVNMYGGGTINGNGQVWYDLYAEDDLILRPILMGIIGLNGGTIGPLKLRYSPQYYHFVANSSNVLFDGIDISGYSKSDNEAKNTDGWCVSIPDIALSVILIRRSVGIPIARTISSSRTR